MEMTEQQLRARVIAGLEWIAESYTGVERRIADEALAVLKAQEARIVKISELSSGEPMLVWLEDIDKEETVAGMIFDYVPGRFGFKLTNIGGIDRIYPKIEDYLSRWRCWTSRPTDEQRKKVKWNG